MQRSVPLASAGLSRLEASIAPPLVAPAPITVWISSMNRIAPGCCLELGQHRLQPLLEIAAVAGAGEQRAHVERDRSCALPAPRAPRPRRCAGPGPRRSRSCRRRGRRRRAGCSWGGGRGSGSCARSRCSRPISGSILPCRGLLVEVDAVVGQRVLAAAARASPPRRSPLVGVASAPCTRRCSLIGRAPWRCRG